MTGEGTGRLRTSEGLASADDLTRFGYPAAAADYIERASVRVRAYTRQDITAATSTVTLGYPFLLPQRPVVSVDAVEDEDGAAVEDYRLRGQYLIVDDARKGDVLTVTYSHGFETVPDGIREVVCAVAARMASAPAGLAAGYQSESADGESIAYGSDAFAGVAELTTAEKRVLDRFFPTTRRVPSMAVVL